MTDDELKRLKSIADDIARKMERKVYIVEHFDRIEIVSEKELGTFYRGYAGPTFLYIAQPLASRA